MERAIAPLVPGVRDHKRAVRELAVSRIITLMSTKLKIPPEFDALPSEERVAYVQELWDRIAETPGQLPIPEEHKRILDERLDAYERGLVPGRPWDEVREEILKHLRGS